jgi:hypothetical protein
MDERLRGTLTFFMQPFPFFRPRLYYEGVMSPFILFDL